MIQESTPDQYQNKYQAALSGQKNVASNAETEQTDAAPETRETVANGIVKNHIIASMGLGLVPFPVFDLAALTITQMNMLNKLGQLYGVPTNSTDTKTLLTSLVGGAIPVLSVLGLSSFAKLIPGIGTLAGSAGVSVIAGAVTYAVGQVFIAHFEAGGTLEDFDPKQAKDFFKREFESGKAFVAKLRDELKINKPSETETETKANTAVS